MDSSKTTQDAEINYKTFDNRTHSLKTTRTILTTVKRDVCRTWENLQTYAKHLETIQTSNNSLTPHTKINQSTVSIKCLNSKPNFTK